jgi:hypothetical protein
MSRVSVSSRKGVKRVVLGDEVYDYDGQHVLITSVDLPTIVQVTKASRDKPYLSLLLQLDRRALSQLLVESRLPPARLQPSSRGIAIGEATVPLLAAFQRLVALLGEPQDIPILAPMVQREILYRLLMSGQGGAPATACGRRKSEPTDRTGHRVVEAAFHGAGAH